MRKTNTAKTPPSDFKVTTPEIPLLSEQAVTSKRIPVPYSIEQRGRETQASRDGINCKL